MGSSRHAHTTRHTSTWSNIQAREWHLHRDYSDTEEAATAGNPKFYLTLQIPWRQMYRCPWSGLDKVFIDILDNINHKVQVLVRRWVVWFEFFIIQKNFNDAPLGHGNSLECNLVALVLFQDMSSHGNQRHWLVHLVDFNLLFENFWLSICRSTWNNVLRFRIYIREFQIEIVLQVVARVRNGEGTPPLIQIMIYRTS